MATSHPARIAHRAGVAERVEEELGADAKTVKERRETTKSGGRVQARCAAACWHGLRQDERGVCGQCVAAVFRGEVVPHQACVRELGGGGSRHFNDEVVARAVAKKRCHRRQFNGTRER